MPFQFTIVVIPVNVTLGARGSVGAPYFLGVSALPLFATTQIIPQVSVDAYAQVAVGGSFGPFTLEGGVQGSLQLLHFNVTLAGEVGLFNDQNGPNILLFATGMSNLNFLSGSLSFFVEGKVPLAGTKRWDVQFFSWPGFTKQGSIFNVFRRTYLNKPKTG